MSVDATIATWKLSKKLITGIQKLILLSLADRAGEEGECWPSLKRLMLDTHLDKHTLVENRQILISKGLIEYTGEMAGRTKSIPVMRLTYIIRREDLSSGEILPASKTSSGEIHTGSSGEIHTAKQCGNPHREPKRIEPKKEPVVVVDLTNNESPDLEPTTAAHTQVASLIQNPTTKQMFDERFRGRQITIEELAKACIEYYGKAVVSQGMFNRWISNERIDNYPKTLSVVEKRTAPSLEEIERISKERGMKEMEEYRKAKGLT